MLHALIGLATMFALATLAPPALTDDRLLITQYEQQLADAITNGQPAVWEKYLDPGIVFAEEDDSYKGKVGAVGEVKSLPKGISGDIRVELLAYQQDGDTTVALFRQHEIEGYYGQTLHASYLFNTVWKKRADGWKQIEGQVLAERTDPPSIVLDPGELEKLVGTYRLRGGEPTYTIRLTDGTLMGGRTGKPLSEWRAETRDVFFIPGDPRIRNIVRYDGAGHVTEFVQRRESWDIVWTRIN